MDTENSSDEFPFPVLKFRSQSFRSHNPSMQFFTRKGLALAVEQRWPWWRGPIQRIRPSVLRASRPRSSEQYSLTELSRSGCEAASKKLQQQQATTATAWETLLHRKFHNGGGGGGAIGGKEKRKLESGGERRRSRRKRRRNRWREEEEEDGNNCGGGGGDGGGRGLCNSGQSKLQ